MTKTRMVVFLILVGMLLIPFVSAQNGCCANLNFFATGEYCQPGAMTKDSCCPASGVVYDPSNPHLPASPDQCKNNFWSEQCSAIPYDRCYVGCCYDPSIGCIGATNDSCLGHFLAQKYVKGFAPADRRADGNPCYSSTGVAAITECQGGVAPTCADYSNNENTCVAKNCYWCSTGQTKCMTDCGSCASQPKDTNGDHRCDAQQLDKCDDADRQSYANCITNPNHPNTMCKWCTSPNNKCLYTCYNPSDPSNSCPGLPYDTAPADKICDSGTTPQCSDGTDNDDDTRVDMNDFCCKSPADNSEDNNCACNEKGFCCTISAAQCDSPTDPLLDKYDKSSCGLVCCLTACKAIPACKPGRIGDSTPAPTYSLGGFCTCNNQPQNITSANVMNKYCCNGYVQNEPCTSTRFFGTVKDPDGALIFYVDLVLKPVSGGNMISFQNMNYPGSFSQNVQPGTYWLNATKSGYQTFKQQITIPNVAEYQMDIVLQPFVAICNTEWPAIALTGHAVKCKRQVDLSWSQNNCLDKVTGWRVYRNDELIGDNIPTATTSYSDSGSGLQWDTNYNYYVKAVHTDSGTNKSNMLQISTGNAECENKCTGQQFCKQQSIVSCTDDNRLNEIKDCTEDSQVCLVDSQNAPYCTTADSCELTKLPFANYLAMFGMHAVDQGIQEACLKHVDGDGSARYCYFDSSSKVADSCKSCDTSMFCYDYNSQNACETNNCRVSKNDKTYNCAWYSETPGYSELGNGVCSAIGYNGTDFCNRCGPSGSLFSRTHCSSAICDRLGACYSKNGFSGCLSCKKPPAELYTGNPTKCSDYVDEQSCVRSNGATQSRPFSITKCTANSAPVKSGTVFVASADACGLGVCKWSSTLHCFKDANDDGKDDCVSLGIACKKDTVAPVTSIASKPEKVNRDTDNMLEFSITDYGWGGALGNKVDTYYCIDENNNCCPNNKSITSKIVLKGDGSIPGLVGKTGKMYLRYFSVDGYNNTEPIKNTTLNVDTKRPTITFAYNVTNNSASTDLSDLGIKVAASEKVADCKDKLLRLTDNSERSLINGGKINTPQEQISISYAGLTDGFYDYSVECKDLFGNSNKTQKFIEIDRVHRIINEHPIAEKFLPSNVISLTFDTAGDQFDCYYQRQIPTVGARVRLNSGTAATSGNYNYAAVLGSFASGNYRYNVQCEKNGKVVAVTNIFFVVDGIAPNTSISYEDYDGHYSVFDSSKWYKKLKMKFSCDDSSALIGTNPGPFGCDSIYYCTGTTNSCIPNTKIDGSGGIIDFSSQQQSFFLRYFSKDLGQNNESTKYALVRIDKSAPSLTITYPQPGAVVSNPILTVAGSWDDAADSAAITIAWQSGINASSATFVSSSKQFSKQITVFKGENTISVRADDTHVSGGANYGQWQNMKVYYDTVGPDFSDVIIKNHLGERIDSQADKSADYGRNVFFSATIADSHWTNNVTFAKFTVECINQTQCSSYRKNFTMQKNGTHFNYTLRPADSGILKTGHYLVRYVAADRFGNTNRFNNTFVVRDSAEFPVTIMNHLGKRIDDGTNDAEYGKPISFVALPSKFDITTSMEMTIKCDDSSVCGDHPIQSAFSLMRQSSWYNLTLQPRAPDIILPSGPYDVTFTAKDQFGKKSTTTRSFAVKDSSTIGAFVLNHNNERVDDQSHNAEYGREISFNLSSTEIDSISAAQLTLVCANQSACGNYMKNFVMQRKGNSFVYRYSPAKDSNGVYVPNVGLQNVLFTSRDIFGMYKTILRNFTVKDSGEALINITVKTSTYNLETRLPKVGMGKSSCKWYDIVVDSNKPINVTSLQADIFRYETVRPRPIDFRNLPVPQVSQNRDRWIYKLCVPYENPSFRYLRGNNTQFLIRAVDLHGIGTDKIVYGKFFEIDTHGGDEPILVPSVAQTYYTKNNMLTISGLTSPSEPSLTVYMNISGSVSSALATGVSQKLAEDEIYLAADAGSSEIQVYGDRQQIFAAGRYLQFEHNRTDSSHYKITSAKFYVSTQATTISISPALEQRVSEREKVAVFNSEKPTGWFSFALTVPKQGKNPLRIWTVDELGNVGIAAKRTIVYDNLPFKVQSFSPHDGTVFADNMPEVSVAIFDDSSDINTSSLKLSINSNDYSCANSLKCEEQGKYVLVTYKPLSAMDDGQYSVSFEGADILGNRNKFSWKFTIDSTTPQLKRFDIIDGKYYGLPYDKWYTTSNKPTVKFFFEPVVISGTVMLKDSPTSFSCDIADGVATCVAAGPIADGSYELIGNFRKNLGSDFGNYNRLTYFVTIDTTNPSVKFNPSYPSSQRTQYLSGSYSDQSMDETDDIIISGGKLVAAVKATLTASNFEGYVTLEDVAEGNYTVTATAYDKAGNVGTATTRITYDLTCSPVRVTSVNSTVTDRSVVKKSDFYYYTNVGTLQDGILVRGVAEPGILRVYNSYKLADTTTEESLQKTVEVGRSFAVNLTLYQDNGENYVTFEDTDLAGNNYSTTVTILSDTNGPEVPTVSVEKAPVPFVEIGKTGMSATGVPQNPDYCMQYLSAIERDSCLINMLLNGAKNVCSYISNYYLRVSCEAIVK